jgi:uncharacterized protein
MVSHGPASAGGTRFDAFRLAAEDEILAGEFDARTLERATDRLAGGSRAALVRWQIAGGRDAMRRPMLAVTIEGELPLICQRCLQAFDAPIRQQTRLLLARDDAELKQLDAEESEVVLAGAPLDARVLVEDELLLSLPFAPHHAEGQCAPGLAWGRDEARGEHHGARSPFASLAELKHRR